MNSDTRAVQKLVIGRTRFMSDTSIAGPLPGLQISENTPVNLLDMPVICEGQVSSAYSVSEEFRDQTFFVLELNYGDQLRFAA
jgi:hypothetical protein